MFVTVSIVVIAFLGLALGRGIVLKNGDTSVEVLGVAEPVSAAEVEAQQPRLEAEVNTTIDELSFEQSAAVSAVDISGLWFGPDAVTYDITQLGSAFVLEEISADGFLTAVGEGAIQGDTAEFFWANNFTSGSGFFTIEGPFLSGVVFDDFTGESAEFFVNR